MKNILILADGLSAEHFIKQINQKRIGDNQYIVVTPNHKFAIPETLAVEMKSYTFDPTSYSKIKRVLRETQFNMVFIVLDSPDETRESLKNIRMTDEKIRIHLLDHWDAFDEADESYTQVFNINQLISNRLFDHLPNVPLVAQNVGLSESEIMEVAVPFGSNFAYRHIGSISQVKWRIVALYRNAKLILPTSATMIRPQDSILIVGKPNILNNIYLRIINKEGLFPEPFGKNLYMILDMEFDSDQALSYMNEAMYMRERLDDRGLIVRIINPGDFELLEKIKSLSGAGIEVVVDYDIADINAVITADTQRYNIGLIFTSMDTFSGDSLASELFPLKKLVYIFGDTPLATVTKSVVLMSDDEEMESISSTSFYISETLGFDLCLCNFDPEGDFASRRMIIEHYETLSHATHYPIKIEEKKSNPVRALKAMENTLQIAPLAYNLELGSFLTRFSTKSKDYLLSNTKHPKLLIPVVQSH
ncbi:MAG: hypothetical protein HF962_05955 [Sulfurovum sp.]|nr:hypothetical protein [Sulfurovum sp.]